LLGTMPGEEMVVILRALTDWRVRVHMRQVVEARRLREALQAVQARREPLVRVQISSIVVGVAAEVGTTGEALAISPVLVAAPATRVAQISLPGRG
jgi:hypothetical protein